MRRRVSGQGELRFGHRRTPAALRSQRRPPPRSLAMARALYAPGLPTQIIGGIRHHVLHDGTTLLPLDYWHEWGNMYGNLRIVGRAGDAG